MQNWTMTMAAVAATLAAAPAHADEDVQGWGAAVAQGAVRGDLYVWLEGQWRVTDDVSRTGQVILRPAAGIRFAPDSTALAGYAFIRTTPENGVASNEHRLWQQVQVPLLRDAGGRPLLISRTRLEQRMIEGAGETGWRLRQFVRGQLPIAQGGAVQAIAITEGFFNLNGTDWGARAGIDQWRTFVGVGLPVARRLRIEPGYLNQRVFRRGEDRTNHVLNATLFYAL
ncbi:DUF2490 domain-containing protein [Sphingomonas baiyangensis]|uniref:DUF2490 domain-containing protein n=1 Tax=Sphingomonas baiyangensis TaxID=2572576 RepID=A0A4U1L408_9SPHN|nr:DUF2490 domain-containing protein [Sphingomonas baiyangensis]TKD50866.1 DUF2490 domain-containing protein [Sphingomonas baiyangensis]